ncbi:MAG: hypothetical protein K9I29_00700 [Bacteroidales bacterium]|nr:hypothetical protein [Bacteroidales bacterium]MCF8326785.1 hypothetical protein [Bacteroidales bacterium]
MIKVILLAIILIGIAIAGIAVKMFFKKDYVFEKKCSTVDPRTGERINSCGCGGSGACDNADDPVDQSHKINIKPLNTEK